MFGSVVLIIFKAGIYGAAGCERSRICRDCNDESSMGTEAALYTTGKQAEPEYVDLRC